MRAIVTPKEMAAIDKAAIKSKGGVSLETLIKRAGTAVMTQALKMLGGTKNCAGKSILVIYGKGNNGADGKYAAELLAKRGFSVRLLSVEDALELVPEKIQEIESVDLIIDAAFGTGLKRPYTAPDFSSLPAPPRVLAVDMPSGVSGLTGEVEGRALQAERTITFGALKSGHLLHPGSEISGKVFVDSIGLDASSARAWLVDSESVAEALPQRPADAHKWKSACWLIGGSPGMAGAVSLMAMGAYRSGSGYVRVSSIGENPEIKLPLEAVGVSLPEKGWSDRVLEESSRFQSVAFGPGMISDTSTLSKTSADEFLKLASNLDKPLLIDGGGLNILAEIGPKAIQSRKAATLLTPHEGEFEKLNGAPVEKDRFRSAAELAEKYNATVLLKGTVSLIASPDGEILAVNTGDERLASAGTGDILSGVVAGLMAQGMQPQMAAAAGAYIHGKAAGLGFKRGLIASDLENLIPLAMAEILENNKEGNKRG